jgi:hypothetical protein
LDAADVAADVDVDVTEVSHPSPLHEDDKSLDQYDVNNRIATAARNLLKATSAQEELNVQRSAFKAFFQNKLDEGLVPYPIIELHVAFNFDKLNATQMKVILNFICAKGRCPEAAVIHHLLLTLTTHLSSKEKECVTSGVNKRRLAKDIRSKESRSKKPERKTTRSGK